METVLSDIMPPKVRAVIYLASVMLAAAWVVIAGEVHPALWYRAAYAAWNAFVGALALSNVKPTPAPNPNPLEEG